VAEIFKDILSSHSIRFGCLSLRSAARLKYSPNSFTVSRPAPTNQQTLTTQVRLARLDRYAARWNQATELKTPYAYGFNRARYIGRWATISLRFMSRVVEFVLDLNYRSSRHFIYQILEWFHISVVANSIYIIKMDIARGEVLARATMWLVFSWVWDFFM